MVKDVVQFNDTVFIAPSRISRTTTICNPPSLSPVTAKLQSTGQFQLPCWVRIRPFVRLSTHSELMEGQAISSE